MSKIRTHIDRQGMFNVFVDNELYYSISDRGSLEDNYEYIIAKMYDDISDLKTSNSSLQYALKRSDETWHNYQTAYFNLSNEKFAVNKEFVDIVVKQLKDWGYRV